MGVADESLGRCICGKKVIKGAFHGDHLKKFLPRRGNLRGLSELYLPHHQTIRKPRKRRRMAERKAVVEETPTLSRGKGVTAAFPNHLDG